jgi:hypothetical protein
VVMTDVEILMDADHVLVDICVKVVSVSVFHNAGPRNAELIAAVILTDAEHALVGMHVKMDNVYAFHNARINSAAMMDVEEHAEHAILNHRNVIRDLDNVYVLIQPQYVKININVAVSISILLREIHTVMELVRVSTELKLHLARLHRLEMEWSGNYVKVTLIIVVRAYQDVLHLELSSLNFLFS